MSQFMATDVCSVSKSDLLKMNQYSSVINQWLVKIVLKHIESHKSPIFDSEFMCELGHIFKIQAVYKYALAFTFC